MPTPKLSIVIVLFFLSIQTVLARSMELARADSLTDTLPNPKKSDVLIRELPLSADKKAAVPAETRAIFPIDTSIKIGRLKNGLTYYIKNNKDQDKTTEWRLVVKAGSLMEQDDQRSFAHFIEHMAFNGSEHFANNELTFFLESSGLHFGRDFGAATGWEETIYFLRTSSFDEKLNETIMLILKDWASGIDFDSVEVEREKGVLLAEILERKSAISMIAENEIKAAFKDTRYAERFPVGDENHIRAVTAAGLEKFYRDWYRPDQMALIIAGDIDPELMEENIGRVFSGLENPSYPSKWTQTGFPANKEPVCLVQTDKELTQTTIQVLFKHPKRPVRELFTYRQGLVAGLSNRMLEERFRLINKRKESPLLMASAGYKGFVPRVDLFAALALAKDGQAKPAMEALLIEIERLKRYGFTQDELEKAKKHFEKMVIESIENKHRIRSSTMADRMASHFLFADPLLSPEQENELIDKYLPHIQLKDVNKMMSQWMPATNTLLFINGPEKNETAYPDQEFILNQLEDVRKMDIDPIDEYLEKQTMLEKEHQPGRIRTISTIDTLGLEHITLENGIQIFLKPLSIEKDQIVLYGFSEGGSANFSDRDYWVLNFSEEIITEMGVSNYDQYSLEDLFYEKDILLNVSIGEYEHSFFGSTPTESLEFLLQMLRLYITEPRMDRTAFDAWVERNRLIYLNVLNDSEHWFNEMGILVKYKDVSRLGYPTSTDFDKMDVNRFMDIYRELFGNSGNFKFVLVGDFDKVEIKKLAEKYIGSLPGKKDLFLEKPYKIQINEGNFTQKLKRKGIEKAKVELYWMSSTEWNSAHDASFRLLQQMLQMRLRDVLREKMGEVYDVSVVGGFDTQNEPYYSLGIYFYCATEKAELLADIAKGVTEEFCDGQFDDNYLTSAKEILLKRREKELDQHIFWLFRIVNAVSGEGSMDDIMMEDYRKILERNNKNTIQSASKKYFGAMHFSRIIMLPEEEK